MSDKNRVVEAEEEAAVSAPEPAPVFDMTVAEFCAGRSASDNRVEMLAAFHHDETAAGRLRDTEQAFAARLEAFATRPV